MSLVLIRFCKECQLDLWKEIDTLKAQGVDVFEAIRQVGTAHGWEDDGL